MTDSDQPRADLPGKSSNRLATMLVQRGAVNATQMQAALALQGDIAQSLVDLGFMKEGELTSFFVKEMKIPRLNLQDYQVNPDMVKIVPRELCLRYQLLPMDTLGKNLTLAMVNPLDDAALEAVGAACPAYSIKPFLCTRFDFESVASRVFQDADAKEAGGSGMSLDSLGLPPTRKAAVPTPSTPPAPAPAPAPPHETDEDDDAHATMIFDDTMSPANRSGGPLRSSLICLDGWELGREIEITGNSYTLGRSAEADTTIRSPLISREHARLTRNSEYGQDTFVITDLKSSNGTFVNNIPVTSTLLRHGDRILLGDVLFKFVLLDEVEARFHKDVHQLYRIQKDTGLLPADAWRSELARVVAAAPATSLSVCLIEMDGLQSIRQAHGHMAGAIVLNDISDLLNRQLEKTDLPGDYSQERIAVLFEGKPIESVFPVLEDLRRAVEVHVFHHKEASFRSTISVGVSSVSDSGLAPEAVVSALENALARAIVEGRNQVSVAT